MVVRKALSRQSGSWYCEVTSGPPLCVSIFAQEEFDTGAWFDGLQAGMNAAIAGMAAPVEILLRAGVEPNTTLVENPYSCQMRSDGKTRKITAIKLLNSIGGRYIGARAESPCSARLERGLYLPFVRIKKRNIAATFATPRADNLRALGPNGSGRGPIRPYRAEASKVTQTAIMAHKGNQNTVVCPRKPYSVESLDTAATNRNAGVAISKTSITAKMVHLRVVVLGTLRPPPTARFIRARSVLDG